MRPKQALYQKSPRTNLGISPIGINDNFIALGGHSLVAARLVFQINESFHLKLPVAALFEFPTVAEMATAIAQNQRPDISMKELEDILTDPGSLTDEEAERLVSNRELLTEKSEKG